MKDLKAPLITASIFSILIFLINIFKNTLFVTVSRSILTGALVFIIIYGIMYLFKNVLRLDADTAETRAPEAENEEPSIDIMLDDESGAADKINYNKANIIEDGDENAAEIYNTSDTENYDNVSVEELSLDSDHIDDIDKIESLKNEQQPGLDKAESKKSASAKPEKTEYRETKAAKEIREDNDLMDTEDYNMEEIVKNPENEDFKNPEDDDFEYYPKDDLKDTEKPLKDRLGFDVSYEDLAKAIRTEMKRDKE